MTGWMRDNNTHCGKSKTHINMSSEGEDVVRFRLVAEMDSGNVYAMGLNEDQQEEFHRALNQIFVGKVKMHQRPFGKVSDMTPSENCA